MCITDFGYDETYKSDAKTKQEQVLREGIPYHIESPFTAEWIEVMHKKEGKSSRSKPQKKLTMQELREICERLSPEELEGMTLEKMKELYGHY